MERTPEDHAVQVHQARLDELQARWDEALPQVADQQGIDGKQDPAVLLEALEKITATKWLDIRAQHPDRAVVLGIAGPGASGKGTLGGYLESELHFTGVTNTTTRQPRHYEVDGQDYFFTEEAGFHQQVEAGDFLQWNEKPGRGFYGIRRDEVERKLEASGGVGCVLEESPANLIKTLGSEAMQDMTDKPLAVVLYVLPPAPIVDTSARRLYHRSAADEHERQLTEADVNSTLGDRQIDEFEQLAALRENPDVHLVIVINDDLQDSFEKLTTLFGPLEHAA